MWRVSKLRKVKTLGQLTMHREQSLRLSRRLSSRLKTKQVNQSRRRKVDNRLYNNARYQVKVLMQKAFWTDTMVEKMAKHSITRNKETINSVVVIKQQIRRFSLAWEAASHRLSLRKSAVRRPTSRQPLPTIKTRTKSRPRTCTVLMCTPPRTPNQPHFCLTKMWIVRNRSQA